MKTTTRLVALAFLAITPLVAGGAAFADSKGCPPGLAKKNPPCVPPGQANKGVTTQEWLLGDRIGDVIDRDGIRFLDDYPRYQLPALPDGRRYAVVNDRIVVLDSGRYEVLQLIRVFTPLGD